MTCTYAMLVGLPPKYERFPVWHCRLEAGHEGDHEPLESPKEIKRAYFLQGKQAKGVDKTRIIEPGKEVQLSQVVKLNKDGTYSAQSNLGKIVNALLASDRGWDIKAGLSEYAIGTGNPKAWSWIEARTPTGQHLIANQDGVRLNGIVVDAKEVVAVV